MEIGYIKLYRKIANSFVWTNPNMLKLWLLCLMKASHKENRFLFNGEEISVNSGQFVTGRDAITKEMNQGARSEHLVSAISVWRWLKKFETEGMLNIKSTTKYSVITIKNWHEYQESEQQVNNKRTSDEQQVNTNKNDKNDKNDKNKDNSPNSDKRTYDENSIHYQLAIKLFERIKENNETIKEPNIQKWADTIRLTMERDNRSEEQMNNVIEWSQKHDFWSGIILSPASLRKNYYKMRTQRINEKNKPAKPHWQTSHKTEELPNWAQEGYESPKEEMMSPESAFGLQYRLYKLQRDDKNRMRIASGFNEQYGEGVFEKFLQNKLIDEAAMQRNGVD